MKLLIQQTVWDKIMAYTDICPDEISGLGKVESRLGQLVVTDVAIFEQKVSGAHSTIEMEALAKFQEERVRAGESMKEWCFWWHSHANMGVFFSGTDTGTIETSTEFPYLVSLVVNKKHESLARLDLRTPVRATIDLQVEILEEVNEEILEACRQEIALKVSRPVHQYSGARSVGFHLGGSVFNRKKPWEDKHFDPTWITMEERLEYWSHRRWLKEQMSHLGSLISPSKKQAKRLANLTSQMERHISWGKKAGIEPLSEAEKEGKTNYLPLPYSDEEREDEPPMRF